MHLLCRLWFFVAHYNIVLMSEHIAGEDNCTADHLSRHNMHSFFSINPQASPIPTPVSPLLLQLLTPRTRLDISHLQVAVSFYHQRGLSTSTIKLHQVGQQRYIQFSIQHNLTVFPTTELILLSFVTYLAKHNITHSTIKVSISAIYNLNVASGQHQHFANQLTPHLKQVTF